MKFAVSTFLAKVGIYKEEEEVPSFLIPFDHTCKDLEILDGNMKYHMDKVGYCRPTCVDFMKVMFLISVEPVDLLNLPLPMLTTRYLISCFYGQNAKCLVYIEG